MKNQRFRRLEVWKKAMEFIKEIYEFTNVFPKEEQFGLTSQIRRAANSIALNIAEGSGSSSDKEFGRFVEISIRSVYEAMCGLEIAQKLNFCGANKKENILLLADEISAMLTGLKKSLKTHKNEIAEN
jgi:four helix bundle protein